MMESYKKYIYWLNEDEENRLREEMKKRGVKVRPVKGVVCLSLHKKIEIASVAPGVWNDLCARQGSWYRKSGKNGLYLIVSNFEVKSYREKLSAIITLTDFTLPGAATQEEKEEMVNDPGFRKQIPDDWWNVSKIEKKRTLKWVNRLGSDIKDYDALHLIHTANHANFSKPRFFVTKDDQVIPYSIDQSAHLCSCCLELFQVLREDFSKILVAPCAGAVIFADLKKDQYLLVEKDLSSGTVSDEIV